MIDYDESAKTNSGTVASTPGIANNTSSTGPMPKAAHFAAWIWAITGWTILANLVYLIWMFIRRAPGEATEFGLAFWIMIGVRFFIGATFIAVADATWNARHKSMINNAVGSIGLGVALVIMTQFLLPLLEPNNRLPDATQPALTIEQIVNLLFGIALITAGIVGLVGGSGYRRWRRSIQG